MDGTYFSPALFSFLRDLAANNNRDWFLAHRDRYEQDVRNPALRFVDEIGPHLRKISPHLIANPSASGGSLFRQNRDTRFSKDKTPYRTVVGISFRHDAGKDVPAPGLYLQLEPGSSWAGGGVYHLETGSLTLVRDAIVDKAAEYSRITSAEAFAPYYTRIGEKLKRPPQGYDPEHPLIEDLKMKSFVWHAEFSEQEVTGPGFMAKYLEVCRASTPWMSFLARALEVDY